MPLAASQVNAQVPDVRFSPNQTTAGQHVLCFRSIVSGVGAEGVGWMYWEIACPAALEFSIKSAIFVNGVSGSLEKTGSTDFGSIVPRNAADSCYRFMLLDCGRSEKIRKIPYFHPIKTGSCQQNFSLFEAISKLRTLSPLRSIKLSWRKGRRIRTEPYHVQALQS